MEELIRIISEIGFPIAIAVYALVRLDQRMATLQETMEKIVVSLRNRD